MAKQVGKKRPSARSEGEKLGKARLVVRQAMIKDIRGIAALVRRAYTELPPYKQSEIRGQINNFPEGCFVALLDEEIVVFERPSVFEYRIVRARPFPVNHTLGRVELEALEPNRTKVTWTSTFEVAVPIVGKRIGNHAASQFAKAFRSTIQAAEKLALA